MSIRVKTELGVDLLDDPFDICRWQVDLVDHRDDLQIVLHGKVEVGQCLGLHALGGIDEQQDAFAGGQRTGHLIREIHVARRVDEVQAVGFPVFGRIGQRDGLALDRNPPLTLDIHVVKHLVLIGTDVTDTGPHDQAVGQCGFSMVDMGNDAEITNVLHILSSFGVVLDVRLFVNAPFLLPGMPDTNHSLFDESSVSSE